MVPRAHNIFLVPVTIYENLSSKFWEKIPERDGMMTVNGRIDDFGLEDTLGLFEEERKRLVEDLRSTLESASNISARRLVI